MSKKISGSEDILIDEDFLAWYFRSDEKKSAAWKQWMDEDPSRKSLVDEAVQLADQLFLKEKELPTHSVQTALEELNEKLSEKRTSVIPIHNRKRWVWIAAAAAAVVAGIFFIFSMNHTKPTLETTFGEIRENLLPDGTQVFLNANSTIEYDDGWKDGGDREVWVKGEAFFNVAKTAEKSKFIVHTSEFDVIVTGTQFNVIDRMDRKNVALTEGSVTIKTRTGQTLQMKPGDFFEVEGDAIVQKTIEKDKVIAWQNKKLILENTPLKDLAKQMEDLYGVNVMFENDIVAKKPLTSIIANDNLDVLLSALEATGDFKITRNGKEIKISLP